jgi:peptidase M23-like protein/Big-like domain-containing protein
MPIKLALYFFFNYREKLRKKSNDLPMVVSRVNRFISFLCCLIFAFIVPVELSQANPKFLTLPLQEQAVVGNGWFYNTTGEPHYAIDYFIGVGTPVFAAADGYAIGDYQISDGYGYGHMVIIRHDETDENGKHYFTIYAHLNKLRSDIIRINGIRRLCTADGYDPALNDGWKRIKQGERIGESGMSGGQTWPHLHFAVLVEGTPWGIRTSMDWIDPYDLEANPATGDSSDYYPPEMSLTIDGYGTRSSGLNYVGAGPNRLWIDDPPLPANYNSSFSWYFNNENMGGWAPNNCDILFDPSNGWLQATLESDPKLTSPYLSIETHPADINETIDLIQIFGRNNSNDDIGEIFIKTDIDTNYTQENSLPFTFPNDNRWHLIQIDVHDIPGWDESNYIHGIRIDPISTVSATEEENIYIDYIRLRKKKAFLNIADSAVRWHPDGTFIKSASNSSVYLLERGLKRPIPDGSIFEAYNYDWTNIITVSDEELACYPTGAPLPLPMSIDRIIKRSGVDENGRPYAKCFQVWGNDQVKRWIKSEEVAEDLGIDLIADIEEVSESEFNSFVDGPDITAIYPEGTIIKALGSPGVYIISNGEARLFSSQATFENMGYPTIDDDGDGMWDSVIEVQSVPQNDSVHLIDGEAIFQCGAGGGCAPQMTWPLGGETLTGGTAREVTYTIPCPESISNVVFSCTEDGYITEKIINPNAPKNSIQTWQIPDVVSDTASVQITAYDLDGRPYSASPERFITIESNASPGQDYVDIYNDGGVALEVSEISLEHNSSWIILNNNIPLPPDSSPLTIGANNSLRIPVAVNKAGLSPGLHSDIMHVVSNDASFSDVTVEIEVNINAEDDAPGAPINATVMPESWSGGNTLSVQWTNPVDPSGIIGGYYKIGDLPNFDTDGVYFDSAETPLQIPMLSDGSYSVYLWLKDGIGNIDHNNHAMVSGTRDTTPPQIVQVTPSQGASDVPIHTSIGCSLIDQFAGIDPDSLAMMINGVTVSPQEVSINGSNVWVEYQPSANFDFNETVTVYLSVNDYSAPANFVETSYTFSTFSAVGDADGDTLSNEEEYNRGTDPLNSDSDLDGMSDGWEVDNGLNPSSDEGIDGPDGDIDGDGLTNISEYLNGQYYSAVPAVIVDAPTGTVSENSFTINIGGDGVVAYKYSLNGGIWQPEMLVSAPIELSGLTDGTYNLHVIGKDQNGYWQIAETPSIAVWDVASTGHRFTLSNAYLYISGIDGFIDQLQVDSSGSSNYGQNIIQNGGKLDWKIDGGAFSNPNTIIQQQDTDRLILNNQAGALWDIRIADGQFSSSLNLAYQPTNVQIFLDTPYEDTGYFDYAQQYHFELGNDHEAIQIPFKTFYAQTGNTRTIEYFMRNEDSGHYLKFRTNSLDDTAHQPLSGINRLIAIGTGASDIDFNQLPSHNVWIEKTNDQLTICSGQDTNLQTINFDFLVTQVDEEEGLEVNENGDLMPYFYTSSNEPITSSYGSLYDFDELLNRFYRQAAFFHTDIGLNVWWNWASQYTGFVNNWYRSKLKVNLAGWEQGDDGYGHYGYMWSWPGNREWPMGDLYLTHDFRFLNTNALFIQAVWNYYAWTGDETFLNAQLQRLRDAMQYQLDWLGGGSEHLINGDNAYDPDHGGINNEDAGTNYWDIMPFGGKDAYCSIDFYKSLKSMAQIEYALGNTSEGDDYVNLSVQARTAFNETFWSSATNRYVGAIDRLGNIHDYGFSFVNIEAVAAGLADTEKANLIYSWLNSGDMYSKWSFAPRTNETTTQNLWRIPSNNGYQWEIQLQDGGANLYVSGYDVIARADNISADDAYARLRGMLERYSEPDKLTGGSPTIFNETIQGGADGPGSLGVMSHEFPESGIAGASFIYALIGLTPEWDGLHIDPKLPSGQDHIGAKNINYRGMNLNFHIAPRAITIECTKNANSDDRYYVVNGVPELFPAGLFTIEVENYDANTDGDVDGSDLKDLCERIDLGLVSNPQEAVNDFAIRYGWAK